MEEKSLYDFFRFGWNYLIMVRGFPSNLAGDVIESLKYFETFLDSHDMIVTKQALKPDFLSICEKFSKLDSKATIHADLSEEITTFSKSIKKTLEAELRLNHAYVLSKKRLGLSKLLKTPSELFSIGTFESLSDFAKQDFSEAGKCIGFERYTAAAFHLLRGTEQTLRDYYLFKVKKNRIKKLFWHDITVELKGKRAVPDSLIAVLDSIREDFRNPTAHPEKTYDEDEIQSLFTHCIDVINRLTHLMK